MNFDEILERVKLERKRQDEKYGFPQHHDKSEWFQILNDEILELIEILWYEKNEPFVSYLIQIIAVGFVWLESLDAPNNQTL